MSSYAGPLRPVDGPPGFEQGLAHPSFAAPPQPFPGAGQSFNPAVLQALIAQIMQGGGFHPQPGAPVPFRPPINPRGVSNDQSVVPQFHPAQNPAGVAGPGARDAAHARAAQVARDAAAKAHAVHLLPMLIEHLRNSVY